MRPKKRLLLAILLLAHTQAQAQDKPCKKVLYTVLAEALGDNGKQGLVTVCKVIQNRMVKRKQTALQVVTSRYQFSCNNKGAKVRNFTDKQYNMALEAWNEAKEYKSPANLYCRYDCHPKWRYSNKVIYIERVGSHVFFRE